MVVREFLHTFEGTYEKSLKIVVVTVSGIESILLQGKCLSKFIIKTVMDQIIERKIS